MGADHYPRFVSDSGPVEVRPFAGLRVTATATVILSGAKNPLLGPHFWGLTEATGSLIPEGSEESPATGNVLKS